MIRLHGVNRRGADVQVVVRRVVVSVLCLMSGVAWGQEAPVITYEDVAGWTGGRYAIIWFDDWGEWPCFYAPEQFFDVQPGSTWDLREYPFNDTVEWSWAPAGPDQTLLFPDAMRIERDGNALFGPVTFLNSPEKELTYVFSLESSGMYLYGSQSRAEFVDSLFSREYQWPDTVMRLPLEFGDRWDSRMLYAREPREESPARDSVLMETLWATREANSYGGFVTLQNDTIPVLGMRAIFDLNTVHLRSGDWNFYQHWYLWLSKARGVVGWARVWPVDLSPSTFTYAYLDTTILRPDTPMDWCGEHSNYLLQVAVRLPDSQQGLAPPTPNSRGRWAMNGPSVRADKCDERVFDITGRRVAATARAGGVGVRVGPDGGLALVVR